MNLDDSAIDMVRTAMVITLRIAAPILIIGILCGLIISLLQSITSIQDQTLSLVPKIVVMLVAALLLLPWVAQRLIEYATELFRLGS